jgi:YD repeat-containing protein
MIFVVAAIIFFFGFALSARIIRLTFPPIPPEKETLQETVMTFDGYGRLKIQKRPEQNTGTATTYNYYADDRIQQIVDARGATVNYSYDARGLVTQISTTSPNPATIPVTPTVTFVYDNVGNRTQMSDGLGTQTYEYDQLSRLTAETRQFSDFPNNPLRLEYTYSLSGQLKSYKEPFGLQVNYAFDKIGRLNTVTGVKVGNNFNYANNPTYNARGNLIALNYANGTSFQISSFNNKLQGTSYELKYGSSSLLSKQYEYYDDGQLKKEKNFTNPNFDKLYLYDHESRLKQALTGAEANGQTSSMMNIPYRYEMQYDAFGHQTQTSTRRYISATNVTNWTYLNNRKVFIQNQTPFVEYDAEGNQTYDLGYLRFDAKSQLQAKMDEYYAEPLNEYFYDGDGKMLKRKVYEYIPESEGQPAQTNISNYYSIRSTALGGEEITTVQDGGYHNFPIYIRANGTAI